VIENIFDFPLRQLTVDFTKVMRAAKATTSLCAKAVASARARSKLAKRNTTNSSVMTTTTTTATRCASSSSSGRDDDEGVSFAVPGLEVYDHSFAVPMMHPNLNYASPTLTSTKTIQIFVREIVASANKAKDKRESLKTCLYLQGGPGFECARVQEIGGWIGHMAKEKNMRVLLLDQRGTGRSSPMTRQKLMREESSMHETLQYYRADSIVEDCEFVRKKMLGEEKKYDVVLGQSFGGFCLTTYLSRYGEEAIENALLTGGVPPLNNKDPKDSYVKLLERVKTQTKKYYSRFPRDKEIMKELAKLCDAKEPVRTLNGNVISARGVQALGFSLGTAGGFERLHYMLENAICEENGKRRVSDEFMNAFDKFHPFDSNPLYALMHESIYMNGDGNSSNWAAERAIKERASEWDPVAPEHGNDGVLFTGEMVLPFFYDELSYLQPMKRIAQSLQDRTDWPKLYDLDKLRTCKTKTACALYLDDMFVDFDLAMDVVNNYMGPNVRVYATNEYMHSGIREDGKRIIDKMIAMLDDSDPLR